MARATVPRQFPELPQLVCRIRKERVDQQVQRLLASVITEPCKRRLINRIRSRSIVGPATTPGRSLASQGLANRDDEFLLAEGLAQVSAHSRRKAVLDVVRKRIGRQRDDRDLRPRVTERTDRARCLEPVHLGHVHVHQDEVIGPLPHRLERLEPVAGEVSRQVELGQHRAHDKLVGGVILGNEKPRLALRAVDAAQCPLEPRSLERSCRVLALGARGNADRNIDPECGARPLDACDADRATHALGQSLADRKPEPCSPITSRDRCIGLAEALEQPVEPIRRDADARILDFNAKPRLCSLCPGRQPDRHRALIRELHAVAEVIQQDLPQTGRVALDELRHAFLDFNIETDRLGARARHHDLAGIVHECVQVEGDGLELHGLRLEFREVEHVVQQGQQALRRIPNGQRAAALFGGKFRVEQHARHAHDTVHRCPDLVADRGKKLGLGAVGGLCCIACIRQRRLGLLAVRDVGNIAMCNDEPVHRRLREAPSFQHPALRAIGMNQPILHFIGTARGAGLEQRIDTGLPVFRMDHGS